LSTLERGRHSPLTSSSGQDLCSKKGGGWDTDVVPYTTIIKKGIYLLNLQTMIEEKEKLFRKKKMIEEK
jgi:hypothetical protein